MSGGVPPFPFLRPIMCVTFWQDSSAVDIPIIYSPSESSSANRPFLTLPAIRQGSPHPRGLGEKGHPLGCCVGDAGTVFLARSVQELPCAIQRQIKGFSCSFGKLRTSSVTYMPAVYEASRSVIGSREGRQFGFAFPAVPFWN